MSKDNLNLHKDYQIAISENMLEKLRLLFIKHPLVLTFIDPEDLHKYRTTTRRLQEDLSIFQDLILTEHYHYVFHNLRETFKTLGPKRDYDVQTEIFKDYRKNLEEKPKGVDELLAWFEKQTKKECKKIQSRFQSLEKDDFYRKADAILQSIGEEKDSPQTNPTGQDYFVDHARRWIPMRVDYVMQLMGTVRGKDDDENLHLLRKACKHLRYALETFSDCFVKDFKEYVKTFKGFQNILGSYQDNIVSLQLMMHIKSLTDDIIELQNLIDQKQKELYLEYKEQSQKFIENKWGDDLIGFINNDANRALNQAE